MGTFVTNSGTVLNPDGIVVTNATNKQERPALAYDSDNNYFLVVWQDYRSGNNYDIYGARVTSEGTVLDLNNIAIATAANEQERARQHRSVADRIRSAT